MVALADGGDDVAVARQYHGDAEPAQVVLVFRQAGGERPATPKPPWGRSSPTPTSASPLARRTFIAAKTSCAPSTVCSL